jgi:dihydroflavonol-4-reductase
MASTSGTIAVSKHADPSLDETCGTPLEIISRWPYYASKAYQEETARRVLGDKVELVMVNPSLLLGPGDDRLSSTRVVLQFLAREILMTPPGGLNFVDVRDVAAILPVAMAKGRSGERYLLGAANWTFNELFGRLERMSKVSGPLMKGRGNVPFWLARAQASLYRHWGKTPPFEPASVEMATYFWYFDDRKAKDELGFAARDPADTLFDTMTYVRERFLEGFKGAVSGTADETSAKASSRARADHAEEEAFEHGMPS